MRRWPRTCTNRLDLAVGLSGGQFPCPRTSTLFAKDVAAATGGKLKITVHPDASLFTAPEIKRVVQIGQSQLGEVLLSLDENDDPIFGIDVVPFLADQLRAESQKLWTASRPAIEKRFAAQRLKVLFAVPWPPQGIYAKKPIDTIRDMKGLFWRAYNAGTTRIAEIVGAHPVTVQAADLPRALSTGLINAFMTSSATGYDSKAWETMSYFYDAQAWIPKNITFVNTAAFDQLDQPPRMRLLKAAAAAEARGWQVSQEKNALVPRSARQERDARGRARRGPDGRLEAGGRAAHRRVAAQGGRRRLGGDRGLQEDVSDASARLMSTRA